MPSFLKPEVFPQPPADAVQMRGLLGERFAALRTHRLHHQEEYHLLWPFQEHCPAGMDVKDVPHPEIARADWQGEFIGTWVATATIAAANAADAVLREKVDRVIAAWLATQAPDGYLGTYDEPDRWKSWDLWIQAHDMVGLLHDYWHLGHRPSLEAAIRIADRVLADFGPGKRSVGGGLHAGMASSAILEPILWLYGETGDPRYLAFGRWLADEDWERPGGPAILSSLLAGRGVAGTGNAKGVEMLLDFAGLVELYRATGEERYLAALLTAQADISQHHLYITGSASTGEHFRADYLLRDDGYFMVGETCVTMAWLYLNLKLGRLTGEARFYDMAEQALYNHLLAAQSPDGRGWAYYTGLRDRKRYRWHTDPDCCPTKGSRALAQAPLNVVTTAVDGLAVHLYEPCRARLTVGGRAVDLDIEGHYPLDGAVLLTLGLEQPAAFTLHLRKPGWCRRWQVKVNGQPQDATPNAAGYLTLRRTWTAGDAVTLALDMRPRLAVDRLGAGGRAAVTCGPLVYAADAHRLPPGYTLDQLVLALDPAWPTAGIMAISPKDGMLLAAVQPIPAEAGEPIFGSGERYHEIILQFPEERGYPQIEMVPFFAAGNDDPDNYRDGVWPNYEGAAAIPEFRYLVTPHPKLREQGVPEGATYQVWLPYTLMEK